MIYILDNGDMFPKLLKTTLKWIDVKVKEVVDLEFEHTTDDILIVNGEPLTSDYHQGELHKKLKNVLCPVIIIVDDSALGWGPTKTEIVDNRPIYIITPSISNEIPQFGVTQHENVFNYLLSHMIEKNDLDTSTTLFISGKNFLRTKHFISLNREKKPHRDYLYKFIKSNNLFPKIHYSYTKNTEPIYLDGDSSWGRHSILDPTLINYPKYFDSYFSIVTLPNYGGNHDDFLDEKIWKPILSFQPFIILGSKGFLKVLKSFGFQTFFDLIDETYDEIEDDKTRWSKACMEIKRLSSKSLTELHSWYYSDDTQSKLKHNVHVAKKLSWGQIDKLSSLIKELDNR